jgi:glucose/arabinose dehydrogenase
MRPACAGYRLFGIACLSSLAALAPLRSAAEVPADFKVETIVEGINHPTCLIHLPDGRILVNEIGGSIKLIKDKKATAIFSLPVSKAAEQGLLKMIAHPAFAANHFLYLYYTTPDNDHHNIDRVVLNDDNTVAGQVNLTKLPKITNVGLHNGSAMAFGKDGMLYVGRGEDVTASWAPLWDTQRGKILRFTEEGKPAPGNPHYDVAAATDEEKSIWARGFRNPWTLTYDPASGRLFEGDVGNLHEEINDVTAPDPAKDYWYGYGPNFPPGDGHDPSKDGKTIDPLYYYNTGSIGCAVLSELPLTSAATRWPAAYKNRIYFSDYCNSWIRSVPMKPAGEGVDVNAAGSGMEIFAKTGFYNPLGMSQGIDGDIYLVAYGSGQVYHISYTGALSLADQGLGEDAGPGLTAVAGRESGLRFRVPGAGTGAEPMAATFTLRGPDGRTQARHAAELRNGEARVQGFRPHAAGILLYALEWREGTATRRVGGRLVVR